MVKGAGAGAVVRSVRDRYPKTHGQELGITNIDTPSGAFRLLVMAQLMSARIKASIAVDAARALFKAGWRTPKAMAAASWSDRVGVLNRAGYARFDERTSTMLADASQHLLDQYRGDLRRLRAAADGDPKQVRRLLKECKGMGDVGVDIFFREAQAAWTELHPFVDDRAVKAAGKLGLPTGKDDLAKLGGGPADLAHLLDGLVRADLDGVTDEVLSEAG